MSSSDEFNAAWCREKHRVIDTKMDKVETRIDKVEARLWGIIVLLLVNLGGIIGVLLKS